MEEIIKKTLCIIQARSGSTRLPNKIFLKVKGKTILEHVIGRVKLAEKVDKIVVATTDKKEDDKVEKLCRKIKIDCFRGSEKDVLDRYFKCAEKYPEYENIVRVTGDCPLIDPKIIDQVILLFEEGKFDYVSNILKETFPDGMDVEIFSREALKKSAEKAILASEREHVTLYIRNNPEFGKKNLESRHNFGHFRLTVDEAADFQVIKFLIENSAPNDDYLKFVSLLLKNPDIMSKNLKIIRNEGLIKSLKEDEK